MRTSRRFILTSLSLFPAIWTRLARAQNGDQRGTGVPDDILPPNSAKLAKIERYERIHVVIIGINWKENGRDKRLRYPANDASELAEVLKQ